MTHPIVKKFLKGKMDAGGTIHALELEIERLQKLIAKLEAAQQARAADECPICNGRGMRGTGESYRECGACHGTGTRR